MHPQARSHARIIASALALQRHRRATPLPPSLLDPPRTTSRAWPGAAQYLHTGSTLHQLTLFTDGLEQIVRREGRHEGLVDPGPLAVRRIQGEGTHATLDDFLGRWHYTGRRGMNGPAFGLYYDGPTAETLVGVCTFARIAHPRWADLTFELTDADRRRRAREEWTEEALLNRTVQESEYLELSRLALCDPASTEAPLGRGAASWFVARCLQRFEQRNRRLWRAQQMQERGMGLEVDDRHLLADARLTEPRKGRGFLKTVVAFADPWEGHCGTVYQALGFHHAGRSPDDGWETGTPGTRSGHRLSRRTLQKARRVEARGHDTAVLRLLWEGGTGTVQVRRPDGTVVHEDDGRWIRAVEAPRHGLDRSIERRWRDYQARMRDRWGEEVGVETRYAEGGYDRREFPPKHRYLLMLGARYWRHELERRCVHLRIRMRRRDEAWRRTGRGPLPDRRSGHYPRGVPRQELRPELRPGGPG